MAATFKFKRKVRWPRILSTTLYKKRTNIREKGIVPKEFFQSERERETWEKNTRERSKRCIDQASLYIPACNVQQISKKLVVVSMVSNR